MVDKSYIYSFLSDKKISLHWKEKVYNSIASIELVFNVQIKKSDITRKFLRTNQILIACPEEMNIEYAKEISGKLSFETLAPVTVIEYKNQYILYMGSVRALLFTQYIGVVDCLIVKCDSERVKKYYNETSDKLSSWSI